MPHKQTISLSLSLYKNWFIRCFEIYFRICKKTEKDLGHGGGTLLRDWSKETTGQPALGRSHGSYAGLAGTKRKLVWKTPKVLCEFNNSIQVVSCVSSKQ